MSNATVHESAQSVNGPFVISLCPFRSCWQCQEPLPVEPPGVVVICPERHGIVDVVLVCSPQCEREFANKMIRLRRHTRIATSTEISSLIRTRRGRLLGVVEGWDGPDGEVYLLVHSGAWAEMKLAEISARSN